MQKLLIFSTLLLMLGAACGELVSKDEGQDTLGLASVTDTDEFLGDELVQPEKIGDAWGRKLSVPVEYAQMTIEKLDPQTKEFLPVGFFNASGVFIDWQIEVNTQYRLGGQLLTKHYPAVRDLLLKGSLPCQDLLEAQRIVVPKNAVVRLGGCARKWKTPTLIIDGVVRSFNPDERGGAHAGSLIIDAETFYGRGIVQLDGMRGANGARGADGSDSDGKDGHPGGRGGNGGKVFVQVHDLNFTRFSVKGGDGGSGGKGGLAGAGHCMFMIRIGGEWEPNPRCRDYSSGRRGANGRRGADGFVTNGPSSR